MKAAIAAIVLAASALAGCGGYTGVHAGGTVTWLDQNGQIVLNGKDSVILAVNSMSTTVAQKADGTAVTYTFSGMLDINSQYAFSIQQQPKQYTCTIATLRPSGTVGGQDVNYLDAACKRNTFTLGGTVNGLTGSGLVLVNGGNTLTVSPATTNKTPPDAVNFAFSVPLVEGATYAVSVLTQPSGQTCSVTSGTGVMPAAAVSSVVVNCQ